MNIGRDIMHKERMYYNPKSMTELSELDWGELSKIKENISNAILKKIERTVRVEIEKFIGEESTIVRTSTDLFGYNKIIRTINNLSEDIEKILMKFVNVHGVINRFSVNALEDINFPTISIDIYLDDGYRRYNISFNVKNIYRMLW